jgi:AcrR family transcriptional regulator
MSVNGLRTGRIRMSRNERLAQILDLARELFSTNGYQMTSMDELAKRVGVSKPVIYELIVSKERLFELCMVKEADDLEAKVAGAVSKGKTAEERLRLGLTAFFEFVYSRRTSWRALLASADAPVTLSVEAIRERQRKLVSLLIGEIMNEYGLKINQSLIEAISYMLNGATEALAIWWLRNESLDLKEIVELAYNFISPSLTNIDTLLNESSNNA